MCVRQDKCANYPFEMYEHSKDLLLFPQQHVRNIIGYALQQGFPHFFAVRATFEVRSSKRSTNSYILYICIYI